MIVGVDVSTKKLAFAGISDDGQIHTAVRPIQDARGARRLNHVRAQTMAMTYDRIFDYKIEAVESVAVEIPWAGSRSSFALLSVAAVTLEAVQALCPYAVVMELTTGEWKRESVGHGNATKLEVMTHALNRGLPVNHDQDLADALCIAEAMVGRYATAEAVA